MKDQSLKFLIINDDKLICLVTGHIIRQYNENITIAIKYDVNSALSYLREILVNKSLKFPDVILLDINMPVMDGVAFLEGFTILSKHQKGVSIYIMTSSIDENIKQIGAKHHFIKGIIELPLTLEKLESII